MIRKALFALGEFAAHLIAMYMQRTGLMLAATYTPKNLIGPAASITSTPTAYVSPAATNGIARTIMACANASAHSITVALGADAAGTRIIAAYPLVANVPALWNGWWVTAQNSAHAIDMSSDTASANLVIGSISGYEYA